MIALIDQHNIEDKAIRVVASIKSRLVKFIERQGPDAAYIETRQQELSILKEYIQNTRDCIMYLHALNKDQFLKGVEEGKRLAREEHTPRINKLRHKNKLRQQRDVLYPSDPYKEKKRKESISRLKSQMPDLF